MNDIYVDLERGWGAGPLFLCGLFTKKAGYLGLHDNDITWHRFLRRVRDLGGNKGSYLFFHGPDIGWLETQFGVSVRDYFLCVNTVRVAKEFTSINCCGQKELEARFKIKRKHDVLTPGQINYRWPKGGTHRQTVVDYNREDVINLEKVVRTLVCSYAVPRNYFTQIALEYRER